LIEINVARGFVMIVHTSMASTANHTDYFVFTSGSGNKPNPWSWEIRRKSKPMGIKLSESGFRSCQAADFAGKRALSDFLIELAREEIREEKNLPRPGRKEAAT
jgi:hypothetical protein